MYMPPRFLEKVAPAMEPEAAEMMGDLNFTGDSFVG
jgi:hypothetical protein